MNRVSNIAESANPCGSHERGKGSGFLKKNRSNKGKAKEKREIKGEKETKGEKKPKGKKGHRPGLVPPIASLHFYSMELTIAFLQATRFIYLFTYFSWFCGTFSSKWRSL